VQKLIAALDPETTNRIEIHDIEPFDSLVRGNVALLGDAGHSTTPDIGQGGCAAMEDAVVLGDCVRDNHMRWRCASTKRCAATGCATWC
jgi:FAD-dependent urate hydroxylase